MKYDEAIKSIEAGGMAWRPAWTQKFVMRDNGVLYAEFLLDKRQRYVPSQEDRQAADWEFAK